VGSHGDWCKTLCRALKFNSEILFCTAGLISDFLLLFVSMMLQGGGVEREVPW